MKKTLENLTKAFIGESQARNRYTFYAKIAKKEGYEQISEIFLLTADNEREHAKWLFRMLNDLKSQGSENLDEMEVLADVSMILGTTAENLKAAIAGEHHEYDSMYPEFAKIAEEEGLKDVAFRLRMIGAAEVHHEERFKKLLAVVEQGTVFKKEEPVEWVCRKCGFVQKGKTPPEKCPCCDHSTSYYQVKCEAY